MGFLESLGKAMSGIFGSQSQGVAKQWEKNLTMEEIEDLERQGCDMTEYRQRYHERKIAEEAEYNRLMNSLDYEKLKEYMTTPRDMESDFVKDTIEMNGIVARKKPDIANAKIVYGAIVQAHQDLWEADEKGRLMGIVFLLSLKEEHMLDQEWLLATARKVREMRDSGTNVPKDNCKFIEKLNDHQSRFVLKLGSSLSGDDDETWSLTYTVDKQSKLPNYCLPPNRIMPLLVTNYSNEKKRVAIELIPAQYYTK